jgi:predicted metalloendopeptidase
MFFISFGQLWCEKSRDQSLKQSLISDSHSPSQFRVLGSTSNFEEFSKTFNCKLGQNNNPIKKCSIW